MYLKTCFTESPLDTARHLPVVLFPGTIFVAPLSPSAASSQPRRQELLLYDLNFSFSVFGGLSMCFFYH